MGAGMRAGAVWMVFVSAFCGGRGPRCGTPWCRSGGQSAARHHRRRQGHGRGSRGRVAARHGCRSRGPWGWGCCWRRDRPRRRP
ncbi:hypothetical protein DFH27DRAFT_580014 [Peziza echinospora]|nr:hypothetical protein DFH27DRAFT_580014 [Peziza echinospora]